MLVKIVVLGDGGVGKTALSIQLTMNKFLDTYDPTIKDCYRKQAVIDNEACMLEILDTAGQEEYTSLRDQWIRDGDGFLLVFSVASKSSFENISTFQTQIVRVKEAAAPVVLVANKADIPSAERVIQASQGLAYAKENGLDFLECSAKTGLNVEKAFMQCARSILMDKGILKPVSKKRRCVMF